MSTLPDPGSMFLLTRTAHARPALQAALDQLHVDLAADREAEAEAQRVARSEALAALPLTAMRLNARIQGAAFTLDSIGPDSAPEAVSAAVAAWQQARASVEAAEKQLLERLRAADMNPNR
ncbi:Uncharacterised protein [Mycobacteroides abscessus subsp. abscessus]|uniref:hypothetical protein n=1 Tax=Mycobacteroides abscessus TaxID=36809 RepID=UPI0009A8A0F2|nr:hypothetical protein [Mycobacteroides abscessus]SLJ22884.1 Uncharacterised protein [Mycobacteroides abscessus subsp. abscessus]